MTSSESDSDSDSAGAAHSRPVWARGTGSPTRLLLLRHGQTPLSVDRRYSGRGDASLTEVGRRQARAAAERLAGMDGVGGATVLSSPLQRAEQTARAVADRIGGVVSVHQGLVETDFGEWEGLTFAEAAERYADEHRRWLSDSTIAPPGGESFQATFERVCHARDEILREHTGQTVVVVSHVTPIKALLRLALDTGPSLFYRLHLDLASLSIVDFYPDGNTSVSLINDISHLA